MAWPSLLLVTIACEYSLAQLISHNRKVHAYTGQDVTISCGNVPAPSRLITDVTIQRRVGGKGKALYHCLRDTMTCVNYSSDAEIYYNNNFTVFHIEIKEATIKHIGTYSCNKYNFDGQLISIENTIVDILVPPSIVGLTLVNNDRNSINRTTAWLEAGTDVSLTCSTITRPAAKITWNAPRWLKMRVSVVGDTVNHYLTEVNSTVHFTMTSKLHKEILSCDIQYEEDDEEQRQLKILVRDPSLSLIVLIYGNRKELRINDGNKLEIVAGRRYIVSCYVTSKTLGGYFPEWETPDRMNYDITTDSKNFAFHEDFSSHISRLHFKAEWNLHNKGFRCICGKSALNFRLVIEGFSRRKYYISASLFIFLIMIIVGIASVVRMYKTKAKTKSQEQAEVKRRGKHLETFVTRRSLPAVPWNPQTENTGVEHRSSHCLSVYDGITSDCEGKDGIESIRYKDILFELQMNSLMPCRWIGKLLVPSNENKDVMISFVPDDCEPKLQLVWRNYVALLHRLPAHCSMLQTLAICSDRDRFFVVHKHVGMITLQTFLRLQCPNQSFNKTMIRLLLKMSEEIVCGVEFLALNECCHPGLSSTTIFVDSSGNCKFYNFCLLSDASDILEQYNLEEDHSLLTSMSPEALLLGEYLSGSDVWSLGMTLWEVFSCGNNPYPGITLSEMKENLQNLKGKRPPKPTNISDEIYDVLQSCWVQRVSQRPTATTIREKLKAVTSYFHQETFDESRVATKGNSEGKSATDELNALPLEVSRGRGNVEEGTKINQYEKMII